MSTAVAPSFSTDRRAARIALLLSGAVALGIVAQSVLAGIFIGGSHPNATDIHKILGPALLLPALGALAVTARGLRSTSRGRNALGAGIAVVVGLVLETGIGFASVDHGALLALHIPIAMLLFAGLIRQFQTLRSLA